MDNDNTARENKNKKDFNLLPAKKLLVMKGRNTSQVSFVNLILCSMCIDLFCG